MHQEVIIGLQNILKPLVSYLEMSICGVSRQKHPIPWFNHVG